jgi:hypothetical protein
MLVWAIIVAARMMKEVIALYEVIVDILKALGYAWSD